MEFKGKQLPTIFHELHTSNLPPYEKSTDRLAQEGMFLLFAGYDTTGNALSVMTYHVLSNPDVLEKLRKEIGPLMLAKDGKPAWPDLEKLSYLVSFCLSLAAIERCLHTINPSKYTIICEDMNAHHS